MSAHVYKLVIRYPEGSDKPDWQPEGYEVVIWETADGYEHREFSWPSERSFLSRKGAQQRAALLRGWGAEVTIIQSLPVGWPQ